MVGGGGGGRRGCGGEEECEGPSEGERAYTDDEGGDEEEDWKDNSSEGESGSLEATNSSEEVTIKKYHRDDGTA
jgi:hypothetical protein